MKAPSSFTLFKLGLPMLGGLLANTMVGVADTAFMGQVGQGPQSAAGYGALFYLVLYVIGMGFALGLQIRTAFWVGAEQTTKVGPLVMSAGLGLVGFGLLAGIGCILGSHALFSTLNADAILAGQTADYLSIRGYFLPVTMANLTCMALFVGTGKTQWVGMANFTGAGLNFVLDYLLIFGRLHFPEMGLEGAALASGISELGVLAVYLTGGLLHFRATEHFKVRPLFQGAALQETLNVGLPLIIQNITSILAWFVFFTFIERTGPDNFNVSIVIRSVYAVFMMVGIAFGAVANAQTSTLLGAHAPMEILPMVKRTSWVSLGIILPAVVFLGIFQTQIFSLFSTDDALAIKAEAPMYVVMVAMVCFAVSHVWFNAISGTGKTWLALGIESSCIFLYLALAYWVTKPEAPFSLAGIWSTEVLYTSVIGLLSALALYRLLNKWKTESVSSQSEAS
jgi:putative MATE family efflux protein